VTENEAGDEHGDPCDSECQQRAPNDTCGSLLRKAEPGLVE
jgi:hypothetical protein